MAAPDTLNIPKPPDNPDSNEMHKWIQDIYGFLQQILTNGNQITMFSDQQISNLKGLEQVGKIFFNSDNNTYHGAINSSGTLDIKTFTLT